MEIQEVPSNARRPRRGGAVSTFLTVAAVVIGITAVVLPLAAASVPADGPVAREVPHHATAGLATLPREAASSVAGSDGSPSGAGQGIALSVKPAPSTVVLGARRSVAGGRAAVVVTASVLSLVPPTGKVRFTDGGSVVPGCGGVTVSSPSHMAGCLLNAPDHIHQPIVATYSGSLSVAASESRPLTVIAVDFSEPHPPRS